MLRSATPHEVGGEATKRPPRAGAAAARGPLASEQKPWAETLPTADEPSRQRRRVAADSRDDQPRFIEVCCGSAGLSSAFIAAGVSALGIDWGGNQHKPKAPWIVLDLSTPNGLTSLLALLEANTAVQAVWLGLPCGTASRARENPGSGHAAPATNYV